MGDDAPKPAAPPAAPGRKNLEIGFEEGVAGGRYANLQVVAASDTEFILDFGFVQPQQPKAAVHSRVILSPRHAKGLMRTLIERIRAHEQKHGEIPMGTRPGGDKPPGGMVN